MNWNTIIETPAGIVASLFLGLVAYFLPALISAGRKSQRQSLIALLNLLTGWTVIGWVAAFIWASVDPPKQ